MKTKYIMLLIPLLILNIHSTPVIAQTSNTNIHTESKYNLTSYQPRADDIRWRLKTINGKTYKRLFNYTQRKWIGDWILA